MAAGSALRAAQAAIIETGKSGGSICDPCLSVLPVSGLSVSTLSGPINNHTVCASDNVAQRLDELQFDLGEGPCWEAFSSRRPVLVPDLRNGVHPAWPVFAQGALETPIAAMFAFPLYVGQAGVGAMDLYSTSVGDLQPGAIRDAGVLAATIAVELMRRILDQNDLGNGNAHPGEQDLQTQPADRRQIHQATGMLIDQLDLPVSAAFARLRAYAFANGSTVAEVARQVLTGDLRFDRDLE